MLIILIRIFANIIKIMIVFEWPILNQRSLSISTINTNERGTPIKMRVMKKTNGCMNRNVRLNPEAGNPTIFPTELKSRTRVEAWKSKNRLPV